MIDSNLKKVNLGRLTARGQKYFPPKIGVFSFVKEFYPGKKVRHFDFAIYQDEKGKRSIAKQWNKSCKHINRYWLRNEINAYREIHRVIDQNRQIEQKYPNFHIPNLLGVVQEKDELTMLIEDIDGQTLNNLTIEKQVAIFSEAVNFINFLGSKLDSAAKSILIKRTMRHIAAMFPFVFALAVISHPCKFLNIARGGIVFCINMSRIFNLKNTNLVHRDLYLKHIITKGNDVWIIDFQISAITNPAFELAGLMIFMWNNRDFCEAMEKSPLMEEVKKEKNKFYSYKILSIYIAIYNLGAVKTIPSDQAFSYLRHYLGLKYQND